MKTLFFSIGFILLFVGMAAQTKDHKLGVNAGGGFQNYRGDLGNSFKLGNTSSYGAVILNFSYYLNRSFDLGIFGSKGDYGFCQPDKIANEEVDIDERCGGCERDGLGNLNSRLTAAGVFAKYKFNNGYLLKENTKLKPYIYVGAAVNSIRDVMRMNCINPGTYLSLNAGIGFKYYINERVNVGYNLALGYFTSDRLDFMTHNTNDMYLQNSVTIGIDLF